jgi:hypothetical protein
MLWSARDEVAGDRQECGRLRGVVRSRERFELRAKGLAKNLSATQLRTSSSPAYEGASRSQSTTYTTARQRDGRTLLILGRLWARLAALDDFRNWLITAA